MLQRIEVKESGSRIDAYIASELDGMSRSYIATLFKEDKITFLHIFFLNRNAIVILRSACSVQRISEFSEDMSCET